MMKKIRICFVTEDFYPGFIGGQGIYSYNLALHLQKLGHSVTVLAEDKKERRKFWNKQKIKVLLTFFCFGNQLLLALFEYIIFKKLKNEYFDILHANQLSGLFFVLFKPSNIGKIIVSVHNTNYDMAQKTNFKLKKLLYQMLIFLEKIVYQKADGLIFNSLDEEKALVKYYQIKNRTKSIYLGVNLPKLKAKNKSQGIILYVGRLVKRKKVDILIRAVNLLNPVRLIIIGQGSERKNLEKIAGSNVNFLGFVKNTRPYFLAADIFVTVSVAEGGFLLSALEAASYGLPLILSSSAAGFPIIKKGINGYIADPDDPKGLMNKIKLVLKRSVQMGKESRKIAKRFSWEQTARNTLSFYLQIFKNP